MLQKQIFLVQKIGFKKVKLYKLYTNKKNKLTNKVTVLQSNLKRCKKPKHKVLTANQIKKGEYLIKAYVNDELVELQKSGFRLTIQFWTAAKKVILNLQIQ